MNEKWFLYINTLSLSLSNLSSGGRLHPRRGATYTSDNFLHSLKFRNSMFLHFSEKMINAVSLIFLHPNRLRCFKKLLDAKARFSTTSLLISSLKLLRFTVFQFIPSLANTFQYYWQRKRTRQKLKKKLNLPMMLNP